MRLYVRLSSLELALSHPGPRRGGACSGTLDLGWPIRLRECSQSVSLELHTVPRIVLQNSGEVWVEDTSFVFAKSLIDDTGGGWSRG